jgi:hypothetical protein
VSELVEGGNAGVCVPCRVAQAISHPNAAPLYVPAVLPLQRESERERERGLTREVGGLRLQTTPIACVALLYSDVAGWASSHTAHGHTEGHTGTT